MSEIRQLLSRRLISLRNRADMSQEELARAAGVGLDAIGRLERGQVPPSLETLQSITHVFQIDLSEFFHFEETKSPNPVLEELEELTGFLATKDLDDIRFFSQIIRTAAGHIDEVRRKP